jgi:biotin operon repressor
MTLVKLARMPSATLKVVAWAMADYANDEGAGIYPSNQTIADNCSLSRSTVIDAIAALEEAGIVVTTGRSAGGRYKDTSIRQLDTDRLLAISRGDKRLGIPAGDSVYVISAITIDGRRRDVHAIIAQAVIDAAAATETSANMGGTSPPAGPVRQPDRSARTTPPVRVADPRGPAGGPNPSKNHPGSTPLPLPPRAAPVATDEGECGNVVDDGGRTTAPPVDAGATAMAAEGSPAAPVVRIPRRWRGAETTHAALATDPALAHVAVALLPVLGTHGPPEGSEPEAYLDQLVDLLAPLAPEVVAATTRWFVDTRYRDLPALALVAPHVATLTRHRAERARRAAAMAALGAPAIDAATAARFRGTFERLAGAAAAPLLADHALVAPTASRRYALLVLPDRGTTRAVELGAMAAARAATCAAFGADVEVEVLDVGHYRRKLTTAAA